MADEERIEGTVSEPEDTETSPEDSQSAPKELDTADLGEKYRALEERYKQSETKITELGQQNADMQRLLDASRIQPSREEKPSEPIGDRLLENPDEVLAEREKKIREDLTKEFNAKLYYQQLATKFRQENPDLAPHEDLVALFMNKTDLSKSTEERLKNAIEMTRNYITKIQNEGAKKLAGKASETKKASVEGGGASKPAPPPKEEEPYEDYMKRRKAQSAKARGLI